MQPPPPVVCLGEALVDRLGPLGGDPALDQPLDDDHVYHPKAMIDKFGFYKGAKVRSPWVSQVLRDDDLGLYGIPESARVIGFLNQAPHEGYLRSRARLIAKLALKSPRFHGVALGSARAADPVVEEEDLTPPANFPQDGLADEGWTG